MTLDGEQERTLAGHLAAVEDPELRTALEALGRSVLGRNSNKERPEPGKRGD